MFEAWFNLSLLAVESQQVIALRMMLAALGGPKVQAEATLMVTEKIAAANHAMGRLMMGATPDSVVTGYRRKSEPSEQSDADDARDHAALAQHEPYAVPG